MTKYLHKLKSNHYEQNKALLTKADPITLGHELEHIETKDVRLNDCVILRQLNSYSVEVSGFRDGLELYPMGSIIKLADKDDFRLLVIDSDYPNDRNSYVTAICVMI